MNIYLDIDGVLLDKDLRPARFVVEFLEYVTGGHDVFWLTTHCKGDARTARDYLADKLPSECLPCLDKIKATTWETLKTEAIDFTKDFRWLDDYPLQAEQIVLDKNNCGKSLVIIDLKQDPNSLEKFINNFC